MKEGGPALVRALSVAERERPTSSIPHYPPFAAWDGPPSPREITRAWKKALSRSETGIAVHFPFCRTVCSFCNISPRRALAAGAREPARFLSALAAEVSFYSGLFSRVRPRHLYVGGGTPNLLGPGQLRRLFYILDSGFDFAPGATRFFEAIPAFIDRPRLRALKASGVTCAALGVQSLDKAVISASGRFQDVSSVKEKCLAVRRAGIPRLMVDLIAGLPGQSERSFLRDVITVASWRPDDIYLGAFDPVNTGFERGGGRLSAAGRRTAAAALGKGLAILRRLGYSHRGAESYATLDPGSANWRGFHPYFDSGSLLALGPGAVSHAAGVLRYSNLHSWEEYEAAVSAGRPPAARSCLLNPRRERISFLLASLDRGRVSAGEFREESGADLDEVFGPGLRELCGRRVLARTSYGYRVADHGRVAYAAAGIFFEPSVIRRLKARRDE
ncbi:MAG: oxygen-independent coproporphyrinogen III oxidase [Elusimicrobia bacterium]|nr:MAG: oxygen-independent coproporphyrinogen III oxidase [Elusimicrobiota bacterium]KAF0155348.1 MAG: oxygen-independent coproporphyrinogen III oxidase [Elusimicrobiota bacterium]